MWPFITIAALLMMTSAAGAQPSPRTDTAPFAMLLRLDRSLAAVCQRCQDCLATDQEIRRRLADHWNRRTAILNSVPPDLRGRSTGVSPDCLNMARLAATGSRPRSAVVNPGSQEPGSRPVTQPRTRYGYSNRPSASSPPRVGGPATPPPASGTEADIRRLFPWPPPTPSTRRGFAVAKLGGGAAATTWGQAADRIEAILQKAQFESWGYYLAADGFAVVTRVEQLDGETGAPLADAQRWPSEPRVASSGGFLGGLLTFNRPVGNYRLFVFAVTSDPVASAPIEDEARFFETARRWAPTGATALPDALKRKVLGGGHQVIVLVYEFEHAVGGRTRVSVPSRWTFEDHIESAGIALQP